MLLAPLPLLQRGFLHCPKHFSFKKPHKRLVMPALVKSEYKPKSYSLYGNSEQNSTPEPGNPSYSSSFDAAAALTDALNSTFGLYRKCGTVIDMAPGNGAMLNLLQTLGCQVYGMSDAQFPQTGLWLPTKLLPRELSTDPQVLNSLLRDYLTNTAHKWPSGINEGQKQILERYLYRLYSRTMAVQYTDKNLMVPIAHPDIIIAVDLFHLLPVDSAIHVVQAIAESDPSVIVVSEPLKGELYWRTVLKQSKAKEKSYCPKWYRFLQDRGYILDPSINMEVRNSMLKFASLHEEYPWLLKNIAILVRNVTTQDVEGIRKRNLPSDYNSFSMPGITADLQGTIFPNYNIEFTEWAKESGASMLSDFLEELKNIEKEERSFGRLMATMDLRAKIAAEKPAGTFHSAREYLEAWASGSGEIIDSIFEQDLRMLRSKNKTSEFSDAAVQWFDSLDFEILRGSLERLSTDTVGRSVLSFCLVSRIASESSTESVLMRFIESRNPSASAVILLYCPFGNINLRNSVLFEMDNRLYDIWFERMVTLYMDGGSASANFIRVMTNAENEILRHNGVAFSPYDESIVWRRFGLGIPRPVVLRQLHESWKSSLGMFSNARHFLDSARGNRPLLQKIEKWIESIPSLTLKQQHRYFHVSYTNERSETTLKQSLNEEQMWSNLPISIALAYSPEALPSTTSKILVVSAQWFDTHSVFRNFEAFVRRLTSNPLYEVHLLFLDSNVFALNDKDHPEFDKIHHLLSTANYADVVKLAKELVAEAFDVVYYTQVGMHPQDIVLANLQLAPVQVLSYGHSSSTHGALLDYFIGGWEAEVATPFQTAYEEAIARMETEGLRCSGECIIEQIRSYILVYENKTTYPSAYYDNDELNPPMLSSIKADHHLSRIPRRLLEALSDPVLHLRTHRISPSVQFVNRLRETTPDIFSSVEKFTQGRYSEQLILVPGMGVSFKPLENAYSSKVSNVTAYEKFRKTFAQFVETAGISKTLNAISLVELAKIYPLHCSSVAPRTVKLSFPWTKVKILHNHLVHIGKLVREALNLGNDQYELHFSPGLDDSTSLAPTAANEAILEALGLRDSNRVKTVLHSRLSPEQFLHHLSDMDLGIDSTPFGACNSVQNMVHTGVVPLVLHGHIWRNQVGAAMLRRAGLEELVSSSETEFIRKGARIISDPLYLAYLKWRVASLTPTDLWYNENDTSAWDHIWPTLVHESNERRKLYGNFVLESVGNTLEALCVGCFENVDRATETEKAKSAIRRSPRFLRHPILAN